MTFFQRLSPVHIGVYKKSLILFYLTCIALQFLGCFSLDPQRFKSPYYKSGRFHNLDPDEEITRKSIFTVIKWKLFGPQDPLSLSSFPLKELEKPPPIKTLRKRDLLAPENKIRIVWLGHATVWIAAQQGGKSVHILTDPIFGKFIFYQKRLIELPIRAENLPPIHAVLVSHAHRDHFDLDSLKLIQKLNPQAQIFLPEGTRLYAKENGLKQIEIIQWWQRKKISDAIDRASIQFTPAQHWSQMGSFDKMQSHWGSYVIELGKQRIYFSGDTAYASHFKKIAQRYSQAFAAALVPIGAFKPRWFMKSTHMDPAEAIQAAKDLNANLLLPIHWGTFALGDDLPSEAILYLKELLKKEKKQRSFLWYPGRHLDIRL